MVAGTLAAAHLFGEAATKKGIFEALKLKRGRSYVVRWNGQKSGSIVSDDDVIGADCLRGDKD